MGGLTTIVTLVGFSESGLGGDLLPIPFILGAVSGGVVSGIGNWIFGCRKLRYKNKLLNYEKNGHSSIDPETIHFGVSQNGVGVFYAF